MQPRTSLRNICKILQNVANFATPTGRGRHASRSGRAVAVGLLVLASVRREGRVLRALRRERAAAGGGAGAGLRPVRLEPGGGAWSVGRTGTGGASTGIPVPVQPSTPVNQTLEGPFSNRSQFLQIKVTVQHF